MSRWVNLGDVLDEVSRRDMDELQRIGGDLERIERQAPTGIFGVACPGCDEEFYPDDLHVHFERTHGTGEIPIPCDEPDCFSELKNENALRAHIGRDHKKNR